MDAQPYTTKMHTPSNAKEQFEWPIVSDEECK